MIWKKGDIWFWHKLGHYIVVPTNAGWKTDGTNVMGAGIAKQAAEKFPGLTIEYGRACRSYTPHYVMDEERLICIPSKRLNTNQPYLSWKNDADYEYVKDGLMWLDNNISLLSMVKAQEKQIYVPLLGAGNGGLRS